MRLIAVRPFVNLLFSVLKDVQRLPFVEVIVTTDELGVFKFQVLLYVIQVSIRLGLLLRDHI